MTFPTQLSNIGAMGGDHHHRKKKSGGASLTTGLVMTAAFGAAWVITDGWYWIFPMLFAGVLPAVEGVRRLLEDRTTRRRDPSEEESYREKQILKAAREQQGVITPAVVALRTELSISQAEKMLESMAQRGYAVMDVSEDGRVEYHFPDFTPRLERGNGD